MPVTVRVRSTLSDCNKCKHCDHGTVRLQLQSGSLHRTEHICSTEKESKHRSHPQTSIAKDFSAKKSREGHYYLHTALQLQSVCDMLSPVMQQPAVSRCHSDFPFLTVMGVVPPLSFKLSSHCYRFKPIAVGDGWEAGLTRKDMAEWQQSNIMKHSGFLKNILAAEDLNWAHALQGTPEIGHWISALSVRHSLSVHQQLPCAWLSGK